MNSYLLAACFALLSLTLLAAPGDLIVDTVKTTDQTALDDSHVMDSILSKYAENELISTPEESDTDKQKRIETIIGIGVVAILFCVPFVWLTRTKRHRRSWESGVFPADLKYKRDNLVEAYIRLGARLLLRDKVDYREKLIYMNSYFQRYFPKSDYAFMDSLKSACDHPVTLKSASGWLTRHMPTKPPRVQIMYFLTGLSIVDGSINDKELKELEDLSHLLGLSPKELNSIVNMYKGYQEEARSKNLSNDRIRAINAGILGVSIHASMDEIKKAYRGLAKLHHPDRFSSETPEQQELAEERFIRVKKAFEYFEKHP